MGRKFSHFRVVADLWRYGLETRKLWLIMLMAVLLILALLILFTESPAVMPFIYSLF